MSKIINSTATYLYLSFEKFKGSKRLISKPLDIDDIISIKAKAFFGYSVDIKVRKLTYICVYANPWFSRKEFITFEVSSVVEDIAPDNIKKSFGKTYTFPKMLPSFVPLNYHMDRAVNSYIDMIIQESIKDKN